MIGRYLLCLVITIVLLSTSISTAAQSPVPSVPRAADHALPAGVAWELPNATGEGAESEQSGSNLPSAEETIAALEETNGPHAPGALDAYDGGRIVFTSFRDGRHQIYLMEADGSNQINLSHSDGQDVHPAMSDFGQIAFLSDRDGNFEIYTMDADGGNQTRITTTVAEEGWVEWAPDGEQLVFTSRENNSWKLETMKRNGTGRKDIFSCNCQLLHPSWSPDGSKIAYYVEDLGIYTIPAAGGDETKIAGEALQEPSWSPDGTKLVATYRDRDQSWIYVLNSDGVGDPQRVSPGASYIGVEEGSVVGGDSWPRWSPDGGRIIYQSTWAANTHQLYVTLADGSTADKHTNLSASLATDYQPEWSPHGPVPYPPAWGSLAAYQTGSVGEIAQIHLYDHQTGTDSVVVQGKEVRLMGIWTSIVVYQQLNQRGSYDLFTHDTATGETRNISVNLPDSSSNRPHLDQGRVIWRQVQGTQSQVNAAFYVYGLVTEETDLLSFFPNQYSRYSRYKAGNGRLMFLDGAGQVYLLELQTGAVQVAPFSAVLPGGSIGNLVAALERGPGGNDQFAIYTITPPTRLIVTDGLELPPAISGETLAWMAGGILYRQQVYDDLTPTLVSDNASSFWVEQDLVVWMDREGYWNPSQGDAAPIYLGVEDIDGDVTYTIPDEAIVHGAGINHIDDVTEDWRDRWLAKVTNGQACYVAGGYVASQALVCSTFSSGDLIYADFTLFVRPQDRFVTLVFKDGSFLDARPGTLLTFSPYHSTAMDTIDEVVTTALKADDIKGLRDSVKDYVEAAERGELDPGELSEKLRAVDLFIDRLLQQALIYRQGLKNNNQEPPQYLRRLIEAFRLAQGIGQRVARMYEIVEWHDRVTYLNFQEYEKKLNQAFRDYLELISQKKTLSDGRVVYVPYKTDSSDYSNQVVGLFRMVLRDGRVCFKEHDWTAHFETDGTFVLSGPGCETVRWSRFEIARLFATADTSVLRREVLRPLFKDSVELIESVTLLLVPEEARDYAKALVAVSKPKAFYLTKGSIQVEQTGRIDVRTSMSVSLKVPVGVEVVVRGARVKTRFDIDEMQAASLGNRMDANATGTLNIDAGMAVIATEEIIPPDAYGVTWQNGDIPLAEGASFAFADRLEAIRPFVLMLWPNETTAVAAGSFPVQIDFSHPMSTTSVLEHASLHISAHGGDTLYDGRLADLPHAWHAFDTILTLQPPAATPGLYDMRLELSQTVVSLVGLPIETLSVQVTFVVVGPIGSAGGVVAAPSGATLTVAPQAVVQATVQAPSADITYWISATRVMSVPVGWLPADGLVHTFGPTGQSLAAPVTISLPVPGAEVGAAIFRFVDGGWQQMESTATPSSGALTLSTTELGQYAAFVPLFAKARQALLLPAIVNRVGEGSPAQP